MFLQKSGASHKFSENETIKCQMGENPDALSSKKFKVCLKFYSILMNLEKMNEVASSLKEAGSFRPENILIFGLF